ncbi:MAG TPA: superoxide dismutase family protein [Polyangiales bacterium]|nr:superoxide dismutase family protein [Polyangiales bacterium]
MSGSGAGGAGAGGSAAAGSGATPCVIRVGSSAGAAAPAPISGVTGMATFTNLGPSVELSIALTGCTSGKNYPFHIHEGTSCTDAMSQGAHWDPPRGEGIPDIPCSGGVAATVYMRETSDAKPWTVGDPAASNVIGHVVVVHDPDDPMKRISCGQIKAQK